MPRGLVSGAYLPGSVRDCVQRRDPFSARRRGGMHERGESTGADLHRHGRHRHLRGCIGHRHRHASARGDVRRGETWTGTLTVPGLEFDLTRPTLAGATNKTVRARKGAKSARVAFRVTAQDDRDGTLRVACTRRSRKPFQDRQDACDLLLDRPQRQHCEGVVHGHRQADDVSLGTAERLGGCPDGSENADSPVMSIERDPAGRATRPGGTHVSCAASQPPPGGCARPPSRRRPTTPTERGGRQPTPRPRLGYHRQSPGTCSTSAAPRRRTGTL